VLIAADNPVVAAAGLVLEGIGTVLQAIVLLGGRE